MRDHPLTNAQLVVGDRIMDLGELAGRTNQDLQIRERAGDAAEGFCPAATAQIFKAPSSQRQQAFGNTAAGIR